MKKKFVLVVLFIVLFLNSINVTAEKGGNYTFEEGNLKMTIPSNYVVFTRDTTSIDAYIKKYGINLKELKDQFINNNIYADILTDKDTEILIMIAEDKSSKDIPNLTDYFKKYPYEYNNMQAYGFIDELSKLGYVINTYKLYTNSNYYFIQFTGYSRLKKAFIEMYATIINGKYVVFCVVPLANEKIDNLQRYAVQSFIDNNVSFYDIQPLPESVKPAEKINIVYKQILFYVFIFIIIFIIKVIIGFKKIKKETVIQREKKFKILQNAIDYYNDISKNNNALTEEESQNLFNIYKKWIYETQFNTNDETAEKGYLLMSYFKNNNKLEYAVIIAKKLIEINRRRSGKWIIEEALALSINFGTNDNEDSQFSLSDLEKKQTLWMSLKSEGMSVKDIKLGYYLMNNLKFLESEKSEAIAKKLIEVDKLNHYPGKKEKYDIIKKAFAYNEFSPLSAGELEIFQKHISSEFLDWGREKDDCIIGDKLKKGFLLLDYFSQRDELIIAEKISYRLIKLCSEPHEIYKKAVTLYEYPQIIEEEFKSLNKALDQLIEWKSINNDEIKISDIQKGYSLLFYFYKEGYINYTKKIAERLIMISETK